MSLWRFLLGMGLTTALGAAGLRRAESLPGNGVVPVRAASLAHRSDCRQPLLLEPGCCWAVELSAHEAAFDLALDAGSQYELIVSSLGEATTTYHIDLEAHAILAELATCRFRDLPVTQRSERDRLIFPGHQAGATFPQTESDLASAGKITQSPACERLLPEPLRERRFFLHVTAAPLEDPQGYVPITGRLAAEGLHARVYVDVELPISDLAPGLVAETIRLLDDEIIPRSRELLGEHADIDGDGKLAVLVTGWLGKLSGGRTSLKGCVRSGDFQPGAHAPFGNRADVLYLNANLEPGLALKTLLAHEYTHAVCFSRRFVREDGALAIEDDWLNEAIAHVAEELHGGDGSNLDERIACFLAAPANAPLEVSDYYRAGLWRDRGCRGATYLFLRDCVDRFGTGLLRELVESPLTGRENLEQAIGIPFSELFRRWTIALANEDFVSIPPSSPAGNRAPLAPSRIEWRVDEGKCPIDVRGSATSFVRVIPGCTRVMRIVFRNPPAAQLQLTILRR